MAAGKKNNGGPAPEPPIQKFIEEMGRFYESMGVPRIGGRIAALLIASQVPLSAEEIAKRLHVARSSVSTNIALLQNRGAAEPVTFPGDRLTYYRFSWDTWQQVIRAQIANFGRVLGITQRALAELADGHPSRSRIMEYNSWVDFFISQYTKILENWPRTRRSKVGEGRDAGSQPRTRRSK
jgi:DNA-binding transcriptional regulator GbsR (MarR family)